MFGYPIPPPQALNQCSHGACAVNVDGVAIGNTGSQPAIFAFDGFRYAPQQMIGSTNDNIARSIRGIGFGGLNPTDTLAFCNALKK